MLKLVQQPSWGSWNWSCGIKCLKLNFMKQPSSGRSVKPPISGSAVQLSIVVLLLTMMLLTSSGFGRGLLYLLATRGGFGGGLPPCL
jgi:hypothetical protein